MASSAVASSETLQAVAEGSAPSPSPSRERAPSLKRPDGASDIDWAIMRAAKNEDAAHRVAEVVRGEGRPCSPEEAAILLDIVSGAEYRAYQSIRKLRESLAPKIATESAIADGLMDAKMALFRIARG